MTRHDRFFALEGLDGAGTTTQARLIEQRLERDPANDETASWITAEPTTETIGRFIREILSGSISVSPETLAHLFAADRSEHLLAKPGGIEARLQDGELVVTDRYLFSSLAYQSVDCGFEYVLSLNSRFALPVAVFYLEVSTEIADNRSATREHREIFEHRDFQESVLGGYERAFTWAQEQGVEVVRIDGSLPPDVIHEKIWTRIAGGPIH